MGAKAVEGKAIFLFLQLPGVAEPRAYQLPWRRELAEQFKNPRRQAERQGGAVKVARRSRTAAARPVETREPMFYVPPPSPLPPKAVQGAPKLLQRDG